MANPRITVKEHSDGLRLQLTLDIDPLVVIAMAGDGNTTDAVSRLTGDAIAECMVAIASAKCVPERYATKKKKEAEETR